MLYVYVIFISWCKGKVSFLITKHFYDIFVTNFNLSFINRLVNAII